MHVMSTDRQYVLHILNCLHGRLDSIHLLPDLCSLAESCGTIKVSIEHMDEDGASATSAEVNITNVEANGVDSPIEESPQTPLSSHIPASELIKECESLLSRIADRALDAVLNCTAVDMRRLLAVYASVPFQSDKLVDAIDEEVSRRKARLEASHASLSVEDLIRRSASNAADVKRSLMADSADGGAPFSAIKKSFKSFFGSSDENHESPEEEEQSPEHQGIAKAEHLHLRIEEALQSIIDVGRRVEDLQASCQVSFADPSSELERKTLFELGRCRELIGHYRRTDFMSGKSLTRFDQERRREMAKRVLSRLLP
jgi:hypothetical protein